MVFSVLGSWYFDQINFWVVVGRGGLWWLVVGRSWSRGVL